MEMMPMLIVFIGHRGSSGGAGSVVNGSTRRSDMSETRCERSIVPAGMARLRWVMSVLMVYGASSVAAAPTEIKGAAILDHACGKVAVQQMGLLNQGKVEEANKLSTPEMQQQWKAMPAKDREMMAKMSKELSETAADYSVSIKTYGVLVVDGSNGKLTVQKKTQDANGSSTTTTTQDFRIDAGTCLVGR
jgi:predicted SnoaL-like aldol condensation-catalyzing enzyme